MKPTSKPLHVYRIDDGGEVFWYIASSRRSALNQFFFDHADFDFLERFYVERMRKGAVIAQTRANWGTIPIVEQVDDDKKMTIRWEDVPEGEDENRTMTCAEWIDEQGQGLLCSTCW